MSDNEGNFKLFAATYIRLGWMWWPAAKTVTFYPKKFEWKLKVSENGTSALKISTFEISMGSMTFGWKPFDRLTFSRNNIWSLCLYSVYQVPVDQIIFDLKVLETYFMQFTVQSNKYWHC